MKAYARNFMKTSALPFLWIALAIVVVDGDYLTGPFITFPIVTMIPVVVASWYSGAWWGIGIGIFSAASACAYFLSFWTSTYTEEQVLINATMRCLIFSIVAFLVARNAKQAKEIKILRGILPICSFCKRIRDENEKWFQIEAYISRHSEALFSHGICPECERKHYPEVYAENEADPHEPVRPGSRKLG